MPKSIRSVLHICVAASLLLQAALAQTTTQPASTVRHDAANATNAGREKLDGYLDGIAADYTANRTTKVAAIQTRAEAEDRQAAVRNKILPLIGTLPQRTALDVQLMGVTQANGFRIQKLLFDSQPGFHVPALL